MTAAAVVRIPMVFADSGVIRMTRPRDRPVFFILRAIRIGVWYPDTQRGASRAAIKNTAENGKLIRLTACGRDRSLRAACRQPAADTVILHWNSRRQTVQNSAHAVSVAFAKQSDRDTGAEGVFQAISPLSADAAL